MNPFPAGGFFLDNGACSIFIFMLGYRISACEDLIDIYASRGSSTYFIEIFGGHLEGDKLTFPGLLRAGLRFLGV